MMDIKDNTLIGMVHLDALPGSPDHQGMSTVVERAIEDAKDLQQGGVKAVLVENFGDKPYPKKISKETYQGFREVCGEVKHNIDLPVGVNVLRNDWISALNLAKELELSFIRVNVYIGVTLTDQGVIQGKADEIQRYIKSENIEISIFADIHVKHGKTLYPEDIITGAVEAERRGGVDALIVSGPATGESAGIEEVKAVKKCADVPVLVGSGVRLSNVKRFFEHADGAIIGSAFKYRGKAENRVNPTRVENMVGLLRDDITLLS